MPMSIDSLPDEILSKIFQFLWVEELINAVSLVSKKWLLKINNDVKLVRFLSIRKPLNRDIDENEQRCQAEGLIQRFNFLKKLELLEPTILPLTFHNPKLDCVKVSLRNGPTVYTTNGNHFMLRLSQEQIMASLEDPLENHLLTNRESILETKVCQLVFNPKREEVTIENIAPENIEDFQVIFNFQIGPDMDEWRRDLIDNFTTGEHSTTTWNNFDPKKALHPPQKILNYSKASRYMASSCTDLAGARF